MYEENNNIELPTICNIAIIAQFGLYEIIIAYNFLWLTPWSEKFFGLIVFGMYTLFAFFAFALTYYIIGTICKWLKTNSTLIMFILSVIVPYISIVIVLKSINGEIPSIFDPRFIN